MIPALIIAAFLLLVAGFARAGAASLVHTPRADALHDAAEHVPGARRVAEMLEERQVIVQKKYVNLGIAVDTANGLVVPAVKDVHLKGMLQLSSELAEVAGRARTGKLKPDDFSDSTFSITNAGNIGGVFATPIINFPEVAILGVHAMRRMPRCVGDEIVAREVMMLSISIDHRLVDGADGARFMVRVKELLENPALMLL